MAIIMMMIMTTTLLARCQSGAAGREALPALLVTGSWLQELLRTVSAGCAGAPAKPGASNSGGAACGAPTPAAPTGYPRPPNWCDTPSARSPHATTRAPIIHFSPGAGAPLPRRARPTVAVALVLSPSHRRQLLVDPIGSIVVWPSSVSSPRLIRIAARPSPTWTRCSRAGERANHNR